MKTYESPLQEAAERLPRRCFGTTPAAWRI